MSGSIARGWRKFLFSFRRRRFDEELRHEVLAHLELRARQLRQQGVDARDADQIARREFGNLTLLRETSRDVWLWPWLEGAWQDVWYGLRCLRREPGFALLVILALGAAIGLNTSLFTVFNAVVLRSWPLKDASRVVRILARSPRPINGAYGFTGVSVAEFRYLADHTQAFSAIFSLAQRRIHFGFEPFGKGSTAILVAADHFRRLGSDLTMGRGFLPEEDVVSAPEPVMVLSYGVWQDHFGSDPAILGKRIPVNDVPFTVVGVAGKTLNLNGEHEDAWIPLSAVQLLYPNDPNNRDWLSSPNACCEPVAGRLAPGVSHRQAAAELQVLDSRFDAIQNGQPIGASPQPANPFVLVDAKILAGDPEAPEITKIFGAMFMGMTLIVLLACANVGNLLVARAAARRREIEVRAAVGASRARIIRQLLTESLLLALGAGGVGVLIAFQFPSVALRVMFENDAPQLLLTPDGTVFAYVLALALLACLCFGLAPAIHGTNPRQMHRFRLRSWLLAVQVVLSVMLLTGAGLMLQGVSRAAHRNPGFQVANVNVTSFELPASAMSQQRIRAFAATLLLEFPGVTGSDPFGLTVRAPLEGVWNTAYRLPQESRDQLKRISIQEVTSGYFATLGIPLLAGRDFRPEETTRPVIVVNEIVARHWPNTPAAVGQTLIVAGTARQIIGVVRNTYSAELDHLAPILYQPVSGFDTPKVIFRSANAGMAPAVEALARRIQPGVRAETLPLSKYVDRRLAPSRASAQIAGVLGVFALALATVGMFGVFAYAVQQRTKEIGIRMALGAQTAQVVRLVVAGTTRALVLGLVVGFGAAAAAARLIGEYLHGLSPFKPGPYTLSATILALASLAASYIPVRRATRIDPMAALRNE
jgi:predicted permease